MPFSCLAWPGFLRQRPDIPLPLVGRAGVGSSGASLPRPFGQCVLDCPIKSDNDILGCSNAHVSLRHPVTPTPPSVITRLDRVIQYPPLLWVWQWSISGACRGV